MSLYDSSSDSNERVELPSSPVLNVRLVPFSICRSGIMKASSCLMSETVRLMPKLPPEYCCGLEFPFSMLSSLPLNRAYFASLTRSVTAVVPFSVPLRNDDLIDRFWSRGRRLALSCTSPRGCRPVALKQSRSFMNTSPSKLSLPVCLTEPLSFIAITDTSCLSR